MVRAPLYSVYIKLTSVLPASLFSYILEFNREPPSHYEIYFKQFTLCTVAAVVQAVAKYCGHLVLN
jgi:hypothetical protein